MEENGREERGRRQERKGRDKKRIYVGIREGGRQGRKEGGKERRKEGRKGEKGEEGEKGTNMASIFMRNTFSCEYLINSDCM